MKFEYKTMSVDGGPFKDEALNRMGEDGWRLVSLVVHGVTFTYVFVREKKAR